MPALNSHCATLFSHSIVSLDAVANDGVLIASAALTEVGNYQARVELRGRTPEGVEFLRTSQHLFDVRLDSRWGGDFVLICCVCY
jgi:hypothetical protein